METDNNLFKKRVWWPKGTLLPVSLTLNRRLRIIVFLMACLFLTDEISSQGILNSNSKIILTSGTNMVIDGSNGHYTSTNGGLISNTSTGGILTLRGNWINNSSNGGFSNAGTTVLFGGTTQFISGTDAVSFYNLSLRNTSLTVSGPQITITNNLNFNKGILHSASNHTINFDNGSSVSGASDSGFVEGPVTKTGNQSFVFPTGANNLYRPIEISAPSITTDQFIAQYSGADPNQYYDVGSREQTIDHVSRCEFWSLLRSAGTSQVNVILSWNSANCGVSIPTDLGVGRWDNTGSIWKDYGNGGITGNTTAGTVSSLSLLDSFGPFALISTSTANPLPIELLNFNAVQSGSAVDVYWSTASETNNDYFTIERTIDNLNFEKVKDIKGVGNSTTICSYCFMDECPYEGTSYYRLRQRDYDGTETYSDIKRVEFNSGKMIGAQIYPNPATADNIRLIVDGMQSHPLLITITDEQGNSIHSERVNPSAEHSVFLLTGPSNECLSPGVYIVTISGNYFSESSIVVIE